MNSYNNHNPKNFENAVDFENARIEKLIEERQDYENSFFVMEDMLKSEEMDFTITQFEYQVESATDFLEYENALELQDEKQIEEIDFTIAQFEYLVESSAGFLEYEKSLELRDEKLIEEYESYESNHLKIPYDEIIEFDALDIQIASHDEDDEYLEYDFDDYDVFFEDDCYFPEPEQRIIKYCECSFPDYLPNDDLDFIYECDYPEGPDENLLGAYIPYF